MKNKNIKKFKQICKYTQAELKEYLSKRIKANYKEVINKKGYIYARGTYPVLLVAHMDTVHKETPKEINRQNGTMSSPQGIGGDDRCGIYIILKIIEKYNCSVLFTEDEESGGKGAREFAKSEDWKGDKYNYIVELDRKGSEDAVFYECANDNFTKFITETGDFTEAYGTYSDICEFAPIMEVAAVNLSSGYYNAHTNKEYIVLSEVEEAINKVERLLARTTETDVFEYVEDPIYSYYGYRNHKNIFSNGYDESEWEDYEPTTWYVCYYDKHFCERVEEIFAASEEEAIGVFLIKHSKMTYTDIIDIYGYDR